MSTGACVGMASQAEEKCDTSLTGFFFPSGALQRRRAIWLEVRKTSGWCCSTKTIGVVCYHKIGQSMQHAEKKPERGESVS